MILLLPILLLNPMFPDESSEDCRLCRFWFERLLGTKISTRDTHFRKLRKYYTDSGLKSKQMSFLPLSSSKSVVRPGSKLLSFVIILTQIKVFYAVAPVLNEPLWFIYLPEDADVEKEEKVEDEEDGEATQPQALGDEPEGVPHPLLHLLQRGGGAPHVHLAVRQGTLHEYIALLLLPFLLLLLLFLLLYTTDVHCW